MTEIPQSSLEGAHNEVVKKARIVRIPEPHVTRDRSALASSAGPRTRVLLSTRNGRGSGQCQ